MATIKQRHEIDGERQKRFRENMLKEGKKPVAAYLTEEEREYLRIQRSAHDMSLPDFEKVKMAPIHSITNTRVVERDSEILRICSNKKILHIGCCDFPYTKMRGENLLHVKLSKVVKPDSLWGLDTSEEGCNLLRDMGFDNILFGSVDRFIPNLKEQFFDIILAGDVIEHTDNPGFFLNSIVQVMSNSSELLLTTNNYSSIYNFIFSLMRKEKVHPDHNFYFSYITLKHLVESCGLNPTEIFYSKVKKTILDKMLSIAAWISPVFSDGIIVRANLRNIP